MSRDSVDAVIAYWKAHDVHYLPGVSDSDFAVFEKKYGVALTEEMRCFYRVTDGTHVPLWDGQDHESFDFYRLSEIAPDSDYRWAMNFANYREMSWWYGIDLIGTGGFGRGTVFMLGARGGKPLVIAHSFAEFLELYARADDRIWQSGAFDYHQSLRRAEQ